MDLIQRTIDLARANVEQGGRPFACIIARGNEIIAEAVNLVAQSHDPTAHAEICAIREAASKLGSEHFTGCDFYIMAHPCPMCLTAMYYCSPERVIFITTREEYSEFHVDDRRYFTLANFYGEIARDGRDRTLPMVHEPRPEAIEVDRLWREKNL
ncbi:MAG: nucleoside deaminase [Isosphaeraceae bacterium]